VAAPSLVTPLAVLGEDVGHVAVIRHDGASYDRYLPDGSLNAASREAVARKFFQTHSDSYDFLVILPAFPVDLGNEVEGLHLLIRNEVSGLGLPITDGGAAFGSPRRLQGYIDLASLVPGSPYGSLEPALAGGPGARGRPSVVGPGPLSRCRRAGERRSPR